MVARNLTHPPNDPRPAGWSHNPRVLGLAVAVVTLAAFAPLFAADFSLWDDPQTISANPRLNPPTWANLGRLWDPRDPPMHIYVPVTQTVWSAVAAVAYVAEPDPSGVHLNPWLFHGANVLLHAASALAAFALLRRLLRGAPRAAAPAAAAAGALLFALHPVQVESVGWASGTKDVLFGLFALLAVWQYVEFADRRAGPGTGAARGVSPASRRRRAHYGIGLACFVLSMLAKPTGIVVPFAAGAVAVLLLGRPWRAVLRDLLPWVLLTIPIVLEGRAVQPAVNAIHPPPALHLRPLVAADALAFYLYKLVWPAHLTITYDRAPRTVLRHGWAYATWVAPAAVAAGAWSCQRRAPWVAAAVALYWIGVAPVLGLVPFDFQFVSTVGDHYLYFALIGPALALAYALVDGRAGRLAWACCAAVLVALGVRSACQTAYWQDSTALFEHAVRVNPNAAAAWSNLGEVYTRGNRLPEALRAYEHAAAAEPDVPAVHTNLAAGLAQLGRFDEAEAAYQTALRLQPGYNKAVVGLDGLRQARAATRPTTTVPSAPSTTPTPPAPAALPAAK